MARLSTHVLDLSAGKPAAGMRFDVYQCDGVNRRLLSGGVLNSDGRSDAAEAPTGIFELVFHAGSYYRGQGLAVSDPPFLDEVVVRFGIADAGAKYHVPLLLSPYGYSTYRGS